MSNSFWNFVTRMVSGTLAKADDVNTNFDGVTAGFTLVETEIDKAITVTNAAGVTDIAQNAATRALKLISFDVNGDVVTSQIVGDWKGDHADAAGTDYQIRDVVKDAAASIKADSLYICTVTHTSTGSLATDTANWDLLVDVEAVAISEAAAAASAAAAAASYDAFDDRYLGSFTTGSEPSLDNDGDALLTGAMYFNTTLNRMKVYNGVSWQLTTANAVDVIITDAGSLITATEVEAALQEVFAIIRDVSGNANFLGDATFTGAVDAASLTVDSRHMTDSVGFTIPAITQNNWVNVCLLETGSYTVRISNTGSSLYNPAIFTVNCGYAASATGDGTHSTCHVSTLYRSETFTEFEGIFFEWVSFDSCNLWIQIQGTVAGAGNYWVSVEGLSITTYPIVMDGTVTATDPTLTASVPRITTIDNSTVSIVGNTDITGNITLTGTVDGRDLATDGSKLDGIEAGADVTDTTNVTAAGALMDSEVDADIKTLSLPASTTISAFGATLIDDLAASNARSTLGLVIGTNVQAYSSVLQNTTASYTTAEETKVGHISVTQAVNLDTMESNIATNNSKVTNATHTGQVTGATALSLGVTAITAQPAAGAVVGTDTLLINDGGVLSEVTATQLSTFMDVAAAAKYLLNTTDTFTGVLTVTGSTVVDGSVYLDSGLVEAGRGSGSVALTINDGYGNANIAFNHRSGSPDLTGSSCRIVTSVDSATATYAFQLGDSTTAATPVALTSVFDMTTSAVTSVVNFNASAGVDVTGNITVTGTVDGVDLQTLNSAVGLNTAKVTNATHTGQVTGSGALSLSNTAISGQTDIGADIVGTDEILISDAGTIRRSDVSRLWTYISAAMRAAASTWSAIQTFSDRVIINYPNSTGIPLEVFSNDTSSALFQVANDNASHTGIIALINQVNATSSADALAVTNSGTGLAIDVLAGDVNIADNLFAGEVTADNLKILNWTDICLFGASSAGSQTSTSTKATRIGAPHYTAGEEPLGLIYASTQSFQSTIAIGGGTGLLNAATSIGFYTAANITTLTGTRALLLDSSQNGIFAAAVTAVGGVDKLTTATGAVSVAAATAPSVNQVLQATSATVATWQHPTVLQMTYNQKASVGTTTATIPFDTTAPQNTEGAQILSASITPIYAGSELRIDVIVFVTPSTDSAWVTAALFRDSAASAVASSANFVNTGTAGGPITFTYWVASSDTTSRVFNVRVGSRDAGTLTWGGQAGAQRHNSTMYSSISITEVVL